MTRQQWEYGYPWLAKSFAQNTSRSFTHSEKKQKQFLHTKALNKKLKCNTYAFVGRWCYTTKWNHFSETWPSSVCFVIFLHWKRPKVTITFLSHMSYFTMKHDDFIWRSQLIIEYYVRTAISILRVNTFKKSANVPFSSFARCLTFYKPPMYENNLGW